jgi:branched-subunit amino acid transport protein
VPATLLTAIAVPGLFVQGGAIRYDPFTGRVLAGIATVVVAWRSRNVVLSIVAGMAAAWLVAWISG